MKAQPVNALASLQSFLDGFRGRIPSCHAVLVTDSDGVVLLKSIDSSTYQENTVDATLSAVYLNSTAQASKLQFGKNKAIVAWQKDRALVHINATPFCVSVICTDGDVGAVLGMTDLMAAALEPLNHMEQ